MGIPATFVLCEDLVGLGGHIANIGVHGTSVPLHIERLWSRSVTISMALVSAHTIPTLLDLAAAGKIDGGLMVTHGELNVSFFQDCRGEGWYADVWMRL